MTIYDICTKPLTYNMLYYIAYVEIRNLMTKNDRYFHDFQSGTAINI